MMTGNDQTGYGRPPAGTRFRKGRSGNPRGRPKGRRNDLPYEAVLGQMVTIREGAAERRVTAAEAFLLYMMKRGLEGHGPSARAALAAIEQAKTNGLVGNELKVIRLVRAIVEPGSVTAALEPLRVARKVDRYRETAKMMLEPWVVEMALGRLGGRRLTVEEQKEVARATRAPSKVRWPAWWGG